MTIKKHLVIFLLGFIVSVQLSGQSTNSSSESDFLMLSNQKQWLYNKGYNFDNYHGTNPMVNRHLNLSFNQKKDATISMIGGLIGTSGGTTLLGHGIVENSYYGGAEGIIAGGLILIGGGTYAIIRYYKKRRQSEYNAKKAFEILKN